MNPTEHNPDVLTCLANLSNDEVFTPPRLVNEMLDLLPEDVWKDKNITFLDPVCKTGVFLREITKRLMVGLEAQIPDVEDRANHIFKNQLFGIAITELTSALSRRTLYCSKLANGKYSVCTSFDGQEGNVRYERKQHSWAGGTCEFCGANKGVYDRQSEREEHAYEFIHTNNPERIFKNMKFDVIVGNPPYQLSDGGGRDSGAIPLYHKFVDQAKKLNPRYITMIIPARWYSGGKGLDEFRNEMLNDDRLTEIHDFPETSDCFPGLNIRGGVCYFLWNKENAGPCRVVNYKKGEVVSAVTRPLLEEGSDVFIRYNDAVGILKKVLSLKEKKFDQYVHARKPFGLDSNFSKFKSSKSDKYSIKLYRVGSEGYVKPDQVEKNTELINKIKVLVSKASPGGDTYPHQIISRPLIASEGTCCTETYLFIGPYENEDTAGNVITYMRTRFFRFMMSLIKNTQNISRQSFALVPTQDFQVSWDDEALYKKYGFTKDEITFIESMIRPMPTSGK